MKIQPRGRGRPTKPEDEKSVVIAVSVSPDLAAFATELGDGSPSKGVQTALANERKRSKKKGKPKAR